MKYSSLTKEQKTLLALDKINHIDDFKEGDKVLFKIFGSKCSYMAGIIKKIIRVSSNKLSSNKLLIINIPKLNKLGEIVTLREYYQYSNNIIKLNNEDSNEQSRRSDI
jgi:hypothetical protein